MTKRRAVALFIVTAVIISIYVAFRVSYDPYLFRYRNGKPCPSMVLQNPYTKVISVLVFKKRKITLVTIVKGKIVCVEERPKKYGTKFKVVSGARPRRTCPIRKPKTIDV